MTILDNHQVLLLIWLRRSIIIVEDAGIGPSPFRHLRITIGVDWLEAFRPPQFRAKALIGLENPTPPILSRLSDWSKKSNPPNFKEIL
jgi:hypothetical protein